MNNISWKTQILHLENLGIEQISSTTPPVMKRFDCKRSDAPFLLSGRVIFLVHPEMTKCFLNLDFFLKELRLEI